MGFGDLKRILKPPRGFRLTKAGKVFFAFLVCLIFVSLSTGNNLLYLVLAAMLGFMVVSGVQSELNLRHLEVRRLLPSEIHAGVQARVGYAVRNPRHDSTRLVLEDLSRVRIPMLNRGEESVFQVSVIFAQRGLVPLGDVRIATTYPYGLFEKSISFPARGEAVVFPRPLSVGFALSKGSLDTGTGATRETVSHVRPYTPGDPLSNVAWKKRQPGLVSRVFEGGSGSSGVVVLTPGPDVETKLSQAAYVIDELHRCAKPFGLLVGTTFSGMGTARSHRIEVLTRLALVERIPPPSYEVIPGDADIVIV